MSAVKIKESNGFDIRWKNQQKKTRKTNKKHDSFFLQLIWVTPAFAFLAMFIFFAAFIVFKNGFNGSPMFLFDWEFSIKAFQATLADPTFQVALKNSLLYVAVVLPVGMIISIGVAKALSTVLNKRIFSFLQGVFFLPYVTSAMAIAMAFAFIFDSNPGGLLNQLLTSLGLDPVQWMTNSNTAIWVLLIFGIWRALPFNIVMLTAAFMRVNPQYYAAASIDGMKKWKQFWRVSIPQIMPMIIYLTTMGIILSFKAMPLGLFPTEAAAEAVNAQTIVFWIYERTTGASLGAVSYQKSGAASIILLAIILGVTILSRIATKYLSRRYK
ncbi:carbohydrate ABC transporter permease [Mesoplasma photuris]|uniref:carbohydrate ABC transporter permease n=1 Tax=Mesoplasma photuris TaxID=217731 RepID=UPI0004E12BC1|nr:sugar ABC transporter permease [Mesoplasma photuris]